MELSGKNIIGNTLSGEGTIIFYAQNPANGGKIEPGFHEASEKEIRLAIEKAAKAFQEYRNKSGKERSEFLEAIAEEITGLDLARKDWKPKEQQGFDVVIGYLSSRRPALTRSRREDSLRGFRHQRCRDAQPSRVRPSRRDLLREPPPRPRGASPRPSPAV